MTGTISEERRIDETISRTASILQTFASILLNCTDWTEQCLFVFVKLIHLKNIGIGRDGIREVSNKN